MEHVNYSLGAIYCTVMNLPRSVRFKVENALLIRTYTWTSRARRDHKQPFVDGFWAGVEMEICGVGKEITVCFTVCGV